MRCTPVGEGSGEAVGAGRRPGWTPRAAQRSRTREDGHRWSRSCCDFPVACASVTAASSVVAAAAYGKVSAAA